MKQIPLTKGKYALVDDADYEWLSQWSWCYGARGYAVRGTEKNGKTDHIYMHVEINKTPHRCKTDHRDSDKLNNQRYNLRTASNPQNGANAAKRKNTSSQYKGVCLVAGKQKWMAYIQPNRKYINLGYFDFDKEHEAALAYNVAAIKYFGEFAKLNEVKI